MESVTQDVGQVAAQQFDVAREPVAEALDSARKALGGLDNEFAHRSARALGMAAGYVRSHDLKAVLGDVERAARENPMRAMVGAAALGLLLGAFVRRH